MIPRQSTCVAIDGQGLLIEGPSGSGKSALALALMDRGATLVGDDSILIDTDGKCLFAYPHPNTRGLIEIRNLGLIPHPVCERVAIGLRIVLDRQAPRFIDTPEREILEGITLPSIRIWPEPSAPVLKAEHALSTYGLFSRRIPHDSRR